MMSVPNKVCIKSKKSEKTCTVCVVMTETWIVNVIVRLHTLITLSSQHSVYIYIYIYTVYIYIFIYMYKHKRAATGLIQINSS